MQKDCSLKVPKGMDLNEMQRTNLLGKGLATTLLSVPLIPVVTNFVGLGLMKLNSNLWQKCGFSPNTQDFLHQLNLKINSFLGNKFSFDSGTGYWLDTSGNIINNINGVLNKAHEALGLAASAGAGVGILKGLKKIGKKACSTFKNKDKENVSFNNNYQNNETILEYPEPTIHNPKSVEKDENIKKQIINDINYSYDQIEQNEVKNYDAKMYEAESRLNELEKLNFKTANQRQEYEDLTNLSNNTFIPTISNDDKARYLYNEMERLQNKENLTYEDKERFRILEDEFNKVNSIIEGGRSR